MLASKGEMWTLCQGSQCPGFMSAFFVLAWGTRNASLVVVGKELSIMCVVALLIEYSHIVLMSYWCTFFWNWAWVNNWVVVLCFTATSPWTDSTLLPPQWHCCHDIDAVTWRGTIIVAFCPVKLVSMFLYRKWVVKLCWSLQVQIQWVQTWIWWIYLDLSV